VQGDIFFGELEVFSYFFRFSEVSGFLEFIFVAEGVEYF
jgi:hypothetical protein